MFAESESDVVAELEMNYNLEKTMVSTYPAWRCPHHLYWSIEPEPRIVCESSHCECWLWYPLLTSSTVAPEPLFEHWGSNRGSFEGRVSMEVVRATPAGLAPEPLKGSWTPLRAILSVLGGNLQHSLASFPPLGQGA